MTGHSSNRNRSAPSGAGTFPTKPPRLYPWPRRTVLLALLLIPIWVAAYLVHHHVRPLAQENGPMENFQAVCMVLGILWFAGTVAQAGTKAIRVLCVGLIIFYGTIVLLEVDLREQDLPLLNRLLNGPVRNVALLVSWLAGGWIFFRHRRETWAAFCHWIRQPAGILLILSGLLWCAASASDKAWFATKDLFVEEWIEVGATFFMLLAAGETWVWNRSLSAQSSL